MSDDGIAPGERGSGGRVIGCFLCATFAPLPRRWKQGRVQLDADGIRWGPGLLRREQGSLLPSLRAPSVRNVHGWERVHIKADAFQIVEVVTDQGEIRLAVPRERVVAVVDHIRANEPRG